MDELKKVKMRTQSPETRAKNFKEVELGYSREEALKEASRCLHCKLPKCVEGCPVKIRIPDFIQAVKEDNIKKAYKIISESSSLPAICGRVCPQEKQCEGQCIRGIKGEAISIGYLERYVADQAMELGIRARKPRKRKNIKIAIVGSGPSGLTCAGDLAKAGFDVDIYEVLHKAGGVLTYGIPEFRLPKAVVDRQVEDLRKLGVRILTNVPVGNQVTIDELKKQYDAIYLATGAGLPKFMGIEGENADNVFSANEVLTRSNLMKAYEKNSKTPIKKGNIAYVIGGGNVAMDAVRTLKRLGIEAHIMYRRGEDELPARKMEVMHAKEEGVIFNLLKNPTKILTDENNNVIGMEVVDMELTEPGEDGRRNVVPKKGSEHTVKCDLVVMALGTGPNHLALKDCNIVLTERDLIAVKGTKTSVRNVYAGGDAVTGAATVILAMEAGKEAAAEIMETIEKMGKFKME